MSALIQIDRTPVARSRPMSGQLGFGTIFTDHLFLADYLPDKGWTHPRVVPYGPLSLDPAASVLHYGQSVFEGIKAFCGVDGQVRLFRPQRHFERLQLSARRLCIPPLDPELALNWLVQLLQVEREWVPEGPTGALYIRPVMFASEPFLGVRPATSYRYLVILSPVDGYYHRGLTPVRIRVEDRYARAANGGVGAAKTSGNYAASLLAAEEAHRDGFDQVLWLDGTHRRYLDEVGTMNVMLRIGHQILTPPLGDTILAGVTRDSALTLLREWGFEIAERPITIDEVLSAHRHGTLHEMWGTGTAAVVCPIGELAYQDQRVRINAGEVGEVTRRLHDAIADIQYARTPDTRGWTLPI